MEYGRPILTSLAVLCLAAAPDASLPPATILADVRRAYLEVEREAIKASTALSKETKYDAAAERLEKVLGDVAEQLRPFNPRDNPGQYPELERTRKLASIYRTRGQLAVKASSDKNSAWLLLASLIDDDTYSLERTTLADPRAQALLEQLRKLDPKAKALFGPRKVKVVLDAPFAATLKAGYLQQLVAQLRLLGLAASSDEGDEEFTVVASEGQVHDMSQSLGAGSADLKSLIACELISVATWKVKGKPEMTALDLGRRGSGFSDIRDSCLKNTLTASALRAPIAILRVWAAR